MPCRDWGQRLMRRTFQSCVPAVVLETAALLIATGCGGHFGSLDAPQSQEGGSQVLAMLLGFKNNDAPAAPGTEVRHVFCPKIVIPEGTAASQAYAGTPPSSANLRHQFSLTDSARECTLDGNQIVIKIGVAGRVLLGPAGSPGSFSVPVRMAIVNELNNQPIISKLYHAAVAVPPGETHADFTIVSEPLRVPFIKEHADENYTIKAGIDEGTGITADKPQGKAAKP